MLKVKAVILVVLCTWVDNIASAQGLSCSKCSVAATDEPYCDEDETGASLDCASIYGSDKKAKCVTMINLQHADQPAFRMCLEENFLKSIVQAEGSEGSELKDGCYPAQLGPLKLKTCLCEGETDCNRYEPQDMEEIAALKNEGRLEEMQQRREQAQNKHRQGQERIKIKKGKKLKISKEKDKETEHNTKNGLKQRPRKPEKFRKLQDQRRLKYKKQEHEIDIASESEQEENEIETEPENIEEQQQHSHEDSREMGHNGEESEINRTAHAYEERNNQHDQEEHQDELLDHQDDDNEKVGNEAGEEADAVTDDIPFGDESLLPENLPDPNDDEEEQLKLEEEANKEGKQLEEEAQKTIERQTLEMDTEPVDPPDLPPETEEPVGSENEQEALEETPRRRLRRN